MTRIAAIRAAIVAKMAAIPDIGIVHAHQPWLKTEARLKDLYVSNGQLRGWFVRRIATAETSPALGTAIEVHRWRIQGFMALDDTGSSELAFDDLIEAIRDAFRADETLGGEISGTATKDGTGIQVEDSLPVAFCGVLCHSALLALSTKSVIT